MNWFDPSDDIVLRPETERARFWFRKYGNDCIEVASQVIYANNGHGHLFDAVCQVLDTSSSILQDFRDQGYCHYRSSDEKCITVYRAPEPAPYSAADLEFLISAGARQILFLNGAGSLNPNIQAGNILLPQQLLREEGTSYHYALPGIILSTNAKLNDHIVRAADKLQIDLVRGDHWTTDAIYRETFGKIERYRERGIISVDMELSALAGVAYFRRCELSAILVVTDIASRSHTWEDTRKAQFIRGIQQAAQIAAAVFPLGSDIHE
jgi:uridine phosphorylase